MITAQLPTRNFETNTRFNSAELTFDTNLTEFELGPNNTRFAFIFYRRA